MRIFMRSNVLCQGMLKEKGVWVVANRSIFEKRTILMWTIRPSICLCNGKWGWGQEKCILKECDHICKNPQQSKFKCFCCNWRCPPLFRVPEENSKMENNNQNLEELFKAGKSYDREVQQKIIEMYTSIKRIVRYYSLFLSKETLRILSLKRYCNT